jgi:hypothetical protein
MYDLMNHLVAGAVWPTVVPTRGTGVAAVDRFVADGAARPDLDRPITEEVDVWKSQAEANRLW